MLLQYYVLDTKEKNCYNNQSKESRYGFSVLTLAGLTDKASIIKAFVVHIHSICLLYTIDCLIDMCGWILSVRTLNLLFLRAMEVLNYQQ